MYFRYTDNRAVIAERINGTKRDVVKEPVNKKRNANWFDKLSNALEN